MGKLVFTSLPKRATPIARSRPRDLTRLLPGTARTMRRMEKVTGRSDDLLIVRGVNLFPTQVEELLLRCKGLSPHYLLEIAREGRLDELTIHVEALPGHADEASRVGQAAELGHHVKNAIGLSARVVVANPGGLERSMGKA